MSARQIPSEDWAGFFDMFSRRYKGRPVRLQILGENLGLYSIARSQPLVGITAQDNVGPREIEVIAGDTAANVTHVVKEPSEVWLEEENNGADSVLKVASKDGISILIDFCSTGAAKTGRS